MISAIKNGINMNTSILFILITTLIACGSPSVEKSKDELAKEERNRDKKNEISNVSDSEATSNQTTSTYSTGDSKDRIKVVSYNVLKYGDACQAPNMELHKYLKTIVKYTSPDILGLVKVGVFKLTKDDRSNDGVYHFQDSIVDKALNAAFPGRYAVCPTTNIAQGNNLNLLFYNQKKFGFSSVKNLCSSETDFDLFKLYNKKLTTKEDTAFLYFILNHTKSGNKSEERDQQAQCIISALKKEFTTLPDVIDMGDFNLHDTEEPGYHTLVFNSDENQRFYDPPFFPDHRVKYPADWTSNPDRFAPFLTTSTRKKEDDPNTCGTGGGAKSWFDHILLSKSLISPANKIHYVPNSYHTIGNDGQRVGISVNQKKHPNTIVPPDVADALFQFSNKYPVMLELEVIGNRNGAR